MAWAAEAWRRFRFLVRRRRADADLDEEMRFHLDMRAEEQRAAGMDDVEAAYAARRRFGSPALLTEEAREAAGWPFAESVWRDVRLGLRSLRRSPGFVAVALVSLGLGIGGNAAVFSFIDALFLSPIPGVADSRGLSAVYYRTRSGTGYFDSISYPHFDYVRTANHSFTGLLAYTTWQVTVRAADHPESVNAQLVSPNYFDVLGMRPAAGRTFLPSEGRTPGADPVAVVAYQYWQQRLGGDRSILGRSLQIGSAMFTVVGVAAPDFRGLSLEGAEPPAMWLLASMSAAAVPNLGDIINQWRNGSFSVAGRVSPGVTAVDAASDVSALAVRVRRDHPEAGPVFASDGNYGAVLRPATQARLSPWVQPDIAEFLELLGVTGVLVFLIACFNLAGLVLARTMRRQNEMALQLSLGASRGRLIRQLLAENVLLSLAGTVAGLLVARWSVAGLSWFGYAFGTSFSIDNRLDGRVLVFAGIVAAICALILTALPARLASQASLTAVMTGGTGTGGSTRRARAQQALVVVQVALSVALLVGASLFVRTLQNARAVDPTVRPQDVLIAQTNLAAAHYDDTRGSLFYAQVLERLRSLPGVREAAFVLVVPLGGRRGGTNVTLMGDDAHHEGVQVGFNVVTPGYFHMIGLPVIAGRDLAGTDRDGTVPVAVINETMAHRMFAGRSPIGERFLVQWEPAKMVEVVGVVRDGRFRNYRAKMEPTVYVPLAQRYLPDMSLEVRTVASSGTMLPAIQREIAAIDKNVPLTRIRTSKEHLDAALARERLTASLLSALGLLALLLAAVGLYGILSYMVAQRRRELGIRVALGARPAGIVRLVLGRVIVLMALGLVAGSGAALVLTRLPFVRGRLFGVEPTDPFSLVAAIAALVLTAVVAAWLPARRAAKADPVVALRYE